MSERAVSPVIGVILMVAIVVILAAIVGTFVFQLAEDTQASSPQASFTFDYDAGADELTVTHDGGDGVPRAELSVTGCDSVTAWPDMRVSAGDSVTCSGPGDTVRVVWESAGSDNSATLATWENPN